MRERRPRPSGGTGRQAEVCAVGIAAGLESRRGPGSDPWTRGASPTPSSGAGAEAGGGVSGGGVELREDARRGRVVPGARTRAAGGEGRGFRWRAARRGARRGRTGSPCRWTSSSPGGWRCGRRRCLRWLCRGPPAGGNMAARASPRRARLRSVDRNSRSPPRPACRRRARRGRGRRCGRRQAGGARRGARGSLPGVLVADEGPSPACTLLRTGSSPPLRGTAPPYDSPWYPGSLLARQSR